MKYFISLSLIFCFGFISYAQMNIDGQIRYGNEWIDYDKTYIKLELDQDAIYKVSFQDLIDQGMAPSSIVGRHIQMVHLGEQVPIYTSNNDTWSAGDYLLFYGEKTDITIDKHLYQNWSTQMLNTEYSLFNDKAAYYLTLDTNSSNLRYNEKTNDLTGNLPNIEPAYMHESKVVYSDSHYKPVIQEVKYSNFVETEGFGTRPQLSTTTNFTINNLVENEGNAIVRVRTGSNNPVNTTHKITLSLNGQIITTDSYNGNRVRAYNEEVSTALLSESSSVEIRGESGSKTNLIVAHASIIYPRSFDFENSNYWEFDLSASFFDRYIEINNFDSGTSPILFNISNGEYQIGIVEEGITKFRIKPLNDTNKYVLFNQNTAPQSVNTISSRNFIDYSQVDPSYLIVTSQKLNNNQSGENLIAEYAEYRSTPQGGSYDTYVVNIEDIYEQFAYGIDRHNIASRNFSHYAKNIWPNLKYWFNIGKALEYNLIRTKEQIEENKTIEMVSTFGAPGSDALMLSDLGEANPLFYFGRLAVSDQAELRTYFDKVKQHNDLGAWDQTVEGKHWTKEMIHLSGGDPSIQLSIFNSLENMRSSIENNTFGAHVNTIRKFSAEEIQSSLSQEVIGLINNGVSLITFFGHSSVGTFDFSLEDPSQYDNTGKYPLIISLGCLSGNVHTLSRGLSEDFVLEPQKGSIAFLAASGTAYVNTQARSGKLFYDLLGGTYYGGTIGEIIKELYLDTADNTFTATRTLMQQLTLHGDPALKINPHEGVDYTIDKSSVSIDPTIVSTNVENFELNFEIVNIGQAREDSINILVQHLGPTGDVFQQKKLRIKAPYNSEMIRVTLDKPAPTIIGKNSIEIIIDNNNEVIELPNPTAENNNRLTDLTDGTGFCFYILDNGIIPVYPSEFAIVNNQCPFELKASTNNAFIDEQNYIFQIDTTELFDSPLLEQGEVTAKGGLVSYTPNMPKLENQVYYWRVSPLASSEIGYLWNNSSFIYISNGEMGWNQSHYYQFLKNDLNTLNVNEDRKWEFLSDTWSYRFDISQNTIPGLWLFIDAVPWGSLNAQGLGSFLGIHIQHPTQLAFRKETNGNYGSLNTPSGNMFAYKMDKVEDYENIVQLFKDIPDNALVLMFLIPRNDGHDFKFSEWNTPLTGLNTDLITELKSYGASKIDNSITDKSRPYLFSFRKGKGLVAEELATSEDGEIEYSFSEPTRALTSGVFSTKYVGPSIDWKDINLSIVDQEVQDTVLVRIYNVNANGTEELIIESINQKDIDISSLNEISSKIIKVQCSIIDNDNRTPPQIDHIKINYTPSPDIAIQKNSSSSVFYKDTLAQGEPLLVSLPLENYTSSEFGSSTMSISLLDSKNNEILEQIDTPVVPSKSEVIVDWSRSSKDLEGLYTWTLNVNPGENPTEQHYFNNFGIGQFFVQKDQNNPVMDVTFDGIHLSNGDIVSSNPEIRITLKDDNPYLALDNPELFELVIEDPSGNIHQIDVNGEDIEFTPAAENEENRAYLLYYPQFTEDGRYKLTAQSRDISNNFSGDNAYIIDFEIITKKSISNVLNYPNPFSSSTEFVFTITGDSAPSDMFINIYTMSGKLVRQISSDELGPIHVGHNRSSYKWNGTDEYGQNLANGVYLYKAVMSNSSEYETYYTEADQFFDNGFSKMVIMR